MAATGCPSSQLTFDTDETLRWYRPVEDVRYGFCDGCGSTLFWQANDAPEWMAIAAGTVDQPSGLSTVAAIWTAEASDYHHLDPNLTNHRHGSGKPGPDIGS